MSYQIKKVITRLGIIIMMGGLGGVLCGCATPKSLKAIDVRRHQVGMALSADAWHQQCRWLRERSANYYVDIAENDAAVLAWIANMVLENAFSVEEGEGLSEEAIQNQNWVLARSFRDQMQTDVFQGLGLSTSPKVDWELKAPQACSGQCLEEEGPNPYALAFRKEGQMVVNDLRYCSYTLFKTETRNGKTSQSVVRRVFDRQRERQVTLDEVIRTSCLERIRQSLQTAFDGDAVSIATLENFSFTPKGVCWTMAEGAKPKTALLTWEQLEEDLANPSLAKRFVNEIVLCFPKSYMTWHNLEVGGERVQLVDFLDFFCEIALRQIRDASLKRVVYAARRGRTVFISFWGDYLDQLGADMEERYTSDAALSYTPFKIEVTLYCEGSTLEEMVKRLDEQIEDCTFRIEWVDVNP